MREVLAELASWWRSGEPAAVATVVSTWNSSPRQPGATMLVGPDGTAVGSVSGGCVEGAVYELATEIRATGQPVLQRYGVSDDDAFAVGLTCGGIIDVFVERIDRKGFPHFGDIADDIGAGRPVAVATVISDLSDGGRAGRRLILREDGTCGSMGSRLLDAAVASDLSGMLAQGRTGIVHCGPDGERRGDELAVFVASYAPRPRMVVFGAIDFAAAAARVGAFLGYRVTVCDARPTFATAKRFPEVDEVIVEWPHRYLARAAENGEIDQRTVVCVLTHDPKFDVPLLNVALQLPLAYIGVMGSRRTNHDRASRLRDMGITEEQLSRLHAPIGLDIGARTPEETAISIAAEIVAARWGGTGMPLYASRGPIHRSDADRATDGS